MSLKNRKTLRQSDQWSFFKVAVLIGLVIYAVCLFLPLLWAFITAFKTQREFRLNIIGLPKEWTWNFSTIYNEFYVPVSTQTGATEYVNVMQMFVYSMLYSVGCSFFGTLVPCVTAYLCARYPYKFSKVIYSVVIIVMALPIVGGLPAEISMAMSLGIYDKIWGLWLMKAHFLGIYFLVFYNMFRTIPVAYTEAARIDGAGNWTVMLKIIMPMAKNTFFTVMLINFITFWNDYQTPLVYLPSYPTLALGMYRMSYVTINELSTVPMRMTAAIFMLIPTLVLFACFHKRLLGNLTVGGIKG